MSGSDLCIPRNETAPPRYFQNRIIPFFYIFPVSVCLFGCSKIGRPILGIYKSHKCRTRPRMFISGKHESDFRYSEARSTSALSAILFLLRRCIFSMSDVSGNKSPATVALKITYCHTWRLPPQRDRSRPLWSACTASAMSLSLWQGRSTENIEDDSRTCRICFSNCKG